MADQDMGTFCENLTKQMQGLSNVIGSQGIAQMITPYDGTPSKFKEWIKDVEKHSVLINIPSGRIKFIAFQTSTGCVSSFLQRYLDSHENATWPDVKAELAARFAEVTDSQHAFLLLRKVKQNKGESVPMYAERLLQLAEEAYLNQSGGVQAIERQLVGFFIDGLLHNYLKLAVMRQNPDNLSTAVDIASTEYNLRQRFDLRVGSNNKTSSNSEPMEVDASKPRFSGRQRYNKQSFQKKTYRPNKNGSQTRSVCWQCGKPGHFKVNCRNRPSVNSCEGRHSSISQQEN